MARKSARKKLYDKLDNICREIVKERAKGCCERCGKPLESGGQMSHVKPKSLGIIYRWNFDNLLWLCYRCHIHWWHKDTLAAAEWFKANWPDRWKKIQRLNKKPVKWSDEDLETIYKSIVAERRLSE